MNILETVGKYAADFNNPGLMLVYVPRELNLDGGGVQTPGIFDVSGDSQTDHSRLRQIRAEAVEMNQLRILFVANMGVPSDFTSLDTEADVALAVQFGIAQGCVKVNKFRAALEKPKDTYFIYEV